jgi:hypothetical protein
MAANGKLMHPASLRSSCLTELAEGAECREICGQCEVTNPKPREISRFALTGASQPPTDSQSTTVLGESVDVSQ